MGLEELLDRALVMVKDGRQRRGAARDGSMCMVGGVGHNRAMCVNLCSVVSAGSVSAMRGLGCGRCGSAWMEGRIRRLGGICESLKWGHFGMRDIFAVRRQFRGGVVRCGRVKCLENRI